MLIGLAPDVTEAAAAAAAAAAARVCWWNAAAAIWCWLKEFGVRWLAAEFDDGGGGANGGNRGD